MKILIGFDPWPNLCNGNKQKPFVDKFISSTDLFKHSFVCRLDSITIAQANCTPQANISWQYY